MKFILPAERLQIQRDLKEMVRGEQGCNITIHWTEEEGAKDEYGRSATQTEASETVRGVVFPAAQRADRARDVERRAIIDQQMSDVSICFTPEVKLKGRKGIWFEVIGIGNYVPDAKGLLAINQASPFFISGETFIREISCKVRV